MSSPTKSKIASQSQAKSQAKSAWGQPIVDAGDAGDAPSQSQSQPQADAPRQQASSQPSSSATSPPPATSPTPTADRPDDSSYHWKQEEVLRVMASLEPNAPLFKVKQAFDPIFVPLRKTTDHNFSATSCGIKEKLGSSITPILILCDKGQVNLLHYAVKNYSLPLSTSSSSADDGSPANAKNNAKRKPTPKANGQKQAARQAPKYDYDRDRKDFKELWGDPCKPLDHDSHENSALHHAASDGNPQLVPYLIELLHKFDYGSASPSSRAFRLISCVNNHGDTPILMAARMGHLVWVESCLEHIYNSIVRVSSVSKASPDSSSTGLSFHTRPNFEDLLVPQQRLLQQFQYLLQHSNHSGDTLLSLAYGHGHAQLVEYLLQRPDMYGIHATADDCTTCQEYLSKASVYVASLSATPESQNAKRKFDGMQMAHRVLREYAQQHADEQMNRLLRELEQEEGTSPHPSSKKKKKQNRKKRSTSTNTAPPQMDGDGAQAKSVASGDTDNGDAGATDQGSGTNDAGGGKAADPAGVEQHVESNGSAKPNGASQDDAHRTEAVESTDSRNLGAQNDPSSPQAPAAASPDEHDMPSSPTNKHPNESTKQAVTSFGSMEEADEEDLTPLVPSCIPAAVFDPPPTDMTPASSPAPRQVNEQELLLDALDALCLDVHDLLKTTDIMATNLSSAQLDGLEHVLGKQLLAVREARLRQNKQRKVSIDSQE